MKDALKPQKTRLYYHRGGLSSMTFFILSLASELRTNKNNDNEKEVKILDKIKNESNIENLCLYVSIDMRKPGYP